MANDYQAAPVYGSEAGSATPMGGEQVPHRSLSNFGDEEEKSFTLYVGNLPLSCIQADIDEIFVDFKQHITKVRMIHDKETARFRGFCYVEFNDVESFKQALAFDGAEYLGHTLKIDYAAPKGRGGGAGGAGGSGFGNRQYNNNNNQQYDSYNQNRGKYNNSYNRSSGGYQNGGGYQQRNSGGYGGQAAAPGGYQDAGAYNSYQRGGYQQAGGYDDRYQQAGGYQQGGGNYNRGGYNQAGGNYRGGRDNYQQNNRSYNNQRYGGGGGGGRYSQNDIITPVEPAPDRPKLELKKREVNAPTAALADSAARSKIFGDALPREFNSKVKSETTESTSTSAPAEQQQPAASGEKQ